MSYFTWQAFEQTKTDDPNNVLRSFLHRYYNNGVYVGLGNGSLAVLDPQDPTAGPSHIIPVGVAPVLSSIIVDDQLWVSCGGSLYQLESPAKTVKVRA